MTVRAILAVAVGVVGLRSHQWVDEWLITGALLVVAYRFTAELRRDARSAWLRLRSRRS